VLEKIEPAATLMSQIGHPRTWNRISPRQNSNARTSNISVAVLIRTAHKKLLPSGTFVLQFGHSSPPLPSSALRVGSEKVSKSHWWTLRMLWDAGVHVIPRLCA